MAAGSRLDVYLHDAGLAGNAPLNGSRGISLRGSSRSISALLRCQAGHYQPLYQRITVVETWYALPLPPVVVRY